jgi:hypothetical protein
MELMQTAALIDPTLHSAEASWRAVAQLDKGDVITELLSRGPQVRVLPGAPFPKEFASLDRQEISRTSKKVITLASSRHNSAIS